MERRVYQRIRISIEGLFISLNENAYPTEIEGMIEDISEGGIKIIIKKDTESSKTPCLKIGDVLRFQAYDEYELFGNQNNDVVSGVIQVVRVDETKDSITLGCKFTSKTSQLEEYISNRKTSSFMSGFSKRQYLS